MSLFIYIYRDFLMSHLKSFNFCASFEAQECILWGILLQIVKKEFLAKYHCEMGLKLLSYEQLGLLVTHIEFRLVRIHEAMMERGSTWKSDMLWRQGNLDMKEIVSRF